MSRCLQNRRRPARFRVPKSLEEIDMAWKTPKIVEIALGAEINCYACAEL
jgi:coenzyme PQQ precursor peptide PqqA